MSVCVCVYKQFIFRSWVCSSLWQEPFVIHDLKASPVKVSTTANPWSNLWFFLDKLNLRRLCKEHLRMLISLWSRKPVGLILLLGQQKAPGSHAWTFPPFPPLEDDWCQNCSKDSSLSSPFSQQRLLVGDLGRSPWLLVASANQLDTGGRKHCLYADLPPPPSVFLSVLVVPWSRWAPKTPLQWGLQQSSGRGDWKGFAQLSAVSLYPHESLAVSVCRHLMLLTCQLAEMELFNVCIVHFWDS